MPLPLTISCSSKSRLVLTFLVLPFWYLLTQVVPDIFQKSSKTVVCVACGRGSVLLRQHCDTLCTSGFVMTSSCHIMALWRIMWISQNTSSITANIPTKFCSTMKTGSTHCELQTGGNDLVIVDDGCSWVGASGVMTTWTGTRGVQRRRLQTGTAVV